MKIQKKVINTLLEKSNNQKLSIQFTLDGFSFCITNLDTHIDSYFCEYVYPKKLEMPEEIISHIEKIFEEDTFLQEDFQEVLVIHQNNLSTLVPNNLFQKEHLKDYLNFTIKTLATDYFAFDDLDLINAKNVYIPFVNVNNYIFQNFGTFEYQHAATVFINKLLQTQTEVQKTMYLNVADHQYSVVVLENKKIHFYNTFEYHTKEDFIYYLLFTAEQLGLDTQKFPLFFTGNIYKESEIFKITYQYIKNVNFLESKNPIFNNSDFSSHTNFILLG